MKNRFLIVISMCVWSLAVAAQTPEQWLDSLASLNKMISQHPRSTDLRLKKAAVNIELGQWEYAVEEYGRVLQLDDKNLAALYYRAYVYNELQRYDLARNDYEAFLNIVPKHFEAQLGLAMVNRRLGRRHDTLEAMNRLVQQFPDSALAYAARAGYETELQQYDVSLYDWDEALRLVPGNVDFMVSKVDILLTLKRYDEAWSVLEDAMKHGVPRSALKPWIDRCR